MSHQQGLQRYTRRACFCIFAYTCIYESTSSSANVYTFVVYNRKAGAGGGGCRYLDCEGCLAACRVVLVREEKPTLHAGQSSPRSLGDSSHPLTLLYTPTSIHTSTRLSTSSHTSESEHGGRGRGDLAPTARHPPDRPTGKRTHPTLAPAHTPAAR